MSASLPEDPLTPAEQRASALLAELRDSQPPGRQLAVSVTRTLRWQRPLRHALQAVGVTGAGIADGVASLVRGAGRGRP